MRCFPHKDRAAAGWGRYDVSTPSSFAELLDAFPSFPVVARGLGVPLSTVRFWSRRNSIPPGYWGDLLALALQLEVRGVTLDALRLASDALGRDRRARIASKVRGSAMASE
jgi:hypothetical protein